MANGKLRQKPCAHTKQKHKHMASKTKSPPMFKPGHEHAANENTHKSNKTVQEHDKHDYTRLTHNNRQDKIRKIKTQRQKGEGGRWAKPVPSKEAQRVIKGPGRYGRVEPGRLRQFSSKGPEWSRRDRPGRLQPNRNPSERPGRGL